MHGKGGFCKGSGCCNSVLNARGGLCDILSHLVSKGNRVVGQYVPLSKKGVEGMERGSVSSLGGMSGVVWGISNWESGECIH